MQWTGCWGGVAWGVRRALCLIGLCIAAARVHAGEVPEQAFTRGEPLPAWAVPLAPVPAPREGLPVDVRVAETQIHLGDEVQYLVQRAVLVRDGAQLSQIGQYPLYFVPAYQRIHLHAAQILRGDQVLDRLPQLQLRFLEREGNADQGLVNGMVTALLVIDDVRVGDTLRLVYTLEGRNPVLGPRYTHRVLWDQDDPVELRRATLIVPPGRHVDWRWLGEQGAARPGPQPLAVAGRDEEILRFEEQALTPPAEEAAVPDDVFTARALQFSEYPDWHAVALWAQTLFPPDAPLPPEMQERLAQWRALPQPEARVQAVLRWVQDEVRYLSVSLGESSHRPAPPAEVLRRRWGDCKDKTYLLVTLLRALGVEADPMLVSLDAPHVAARLLPDPDAFDHVVARVRLGDRAYTLDPTRLGQRGSLAAMETMDGADGLVVRDDTQALLQLRVADAAAQARNELSEQFQIPSFDAPAQLLMSETWHGSEAELMRLAYARMTPEQQRRHLLGLYERRYPGARLQGEVQVRDEAETNAFTLQARLELPGALLHVDRDWALRFTPADLLLALRWPETSGRRWPLKLGERPLNARYRLRVQWPEAVSELREPGSVHLANAAFSADVERRFQGSVMTLDAQLVSKRLRVDAAELPRLLQDRKALEQALMGVVSVSEAALKQPGLLGIGRVTAQDLWSARLQRRIERNTRAIEGGQIRGEDLALALCERAQARAQRGELAGARQDASAAVQAAPDLGAAFACRAEVSFDSGAFDEAADAYAQALRLGEDAPPLLLKRGLSRFYAGHFEAAAQDFEQAAALREAGVASDDAVRARLWQAWALQRAAQPLPAALLERASAAARQPWPAPALALAAGLLGEDELLARAAQAHGDEHELALAEAWFDVAQHRRAQGRTDDARRAFERARAQSLPLRVEHWASAFELSHLGGVEGGAAGANGFLMRSAPQSP